MTTIASNPSGPGADFLKSWRVSFSTPGTSMPVDQRFFFERVTPPASGGGPYFRLVAEGPHELGADWTEARFELHGNSLVADFATNRGALVPWRLSLVDGEKLIAGAAISGRNMESAGTWEANEETGETVG